MSSFTKPLIIKRVGNRTWELYKSFDYHVGSEDSNDVITVPAGFKTDFASVPRFLWAILPPDGPYTGASVIHDYLYNQQKRTRKESDNIFLEAMGVLNVSSWKRYVMHKALRIFGGFAWRKNNV